MNYKLALNKEDIAKYIESSKILALDIETSPLLQYKNDAKASLDAHKSTNRDEFFGFKRQRDLCTISSQSWLKC